MEKIKRKKGGTNKRLANSDSDEKSERIVSKAPRRGENNIGGDSDASLSLDEMNVDDEWLNSDGFTKVVNRKKRNRNKQVADIEKSGDGNTTRNTPAKQHGQQHSTRIHSQRNIKLFFPTDVGKSY